MSKFDGVINSARRRNQSSQTQGDVAAKDAYAPSVKSAGGGEQKRRESLAEHKAQPEAQKESAPRGRGRPPGGKRSNPDYVLLSGYVPKGLVRRVDLALSAEAMSRERKQEYSELIEELLTNWLESRE